MVTVHANAEFRGKGYALNADPAGTRPALSTFYGSDSELTHRNPETGIGPHALQGVGYGCPAGWDARCHPTTGDRE